MPQVRPSECLTQNGEVLCITVGQRRTQSKNSPLALLAAVAYRSAYLKSRVILISRLLTLITESVVKRPSPREVVRASAFFESNFLCPVSADRSHDLVQFVTCLGHLVYETQPLPFRPRRKCLEAAGS